MKLKTLLIGATAFALAFLTGCEPNETDLIMGANTAGNLGLSAWFAIDDPGPEVKGVLKDVVTTVDGASSTIGTGGSYVDSLTPAVQEIIARHEKLTPAQKNLINTGSSVILSGLDTFIDANPKVKENAETGAKVIAAFCKGCLTAIDRSEASAAAKSIRKAHQVIRMQYDAKAKAFVAQ